MMRSRWWSFLHRKRAERDLDDEIRFHLETLAEDYESHGFSREDARTAARRDFGGIAQTKEAYRDRQRVAFIESTWQDLRYGMRGLLRSPGFTCAAVLSLALGIGANTAIFSVTNALLFRLLPVRDPQQLVWLYRTGGWGRGHTSHPMFEQTSRGTDVFSGVVARDSTERVRFSDAQSSDRPQFLSREFVSANYFDVLGVPAAVGRVLTAADRGAQPYAVLSYEFWQARFR